MLNVLGVDLFQGRVTGAGIVMAEHRPIGLPRCGKGWKEKGTEDGGECSESQVSSLFNVTYR
jgi:hypothetical protein